MLGAAVKVLKVLSVLAVLVVERSRDCRLNGKGKGIAEVFVLRSLPITPFMNAGNPSGPSVAPVFFKNDGKGSHGPIFIFRSVPSPARKDGTDPAPKGLT